MKPTDDDRDLQALFTALRQADRGTAGAFETLLARPKEPIFGAPTTPRALLIAASLFLLVATGARWWWAAEQASRHQETAAALIAWRAPSDVLLDTPGRSLLSELPTLGPSLLPLSNGDRPKALAAGTPIG